MSNTPRGENAAENESGRPEHDRALMHHDDYYACEQPERPADGLTWFERRCRSCMVALGAAALHNPTWPIVNEWDQTSGDALSRYEAYRGEHGLPSLDDFGVPA